jgi:aromatic ring-opening dioxygenase catalytic subunit (LigB family)
MTPVLFIGHGHPLNAIQRNDFTAALRFPIPQ